MLFQKQNGISRALQHIHRHFTEPVSVESLPKIAGLSRSRLFNDFKESIGRTPGKEVTRLRIELAKQMLIETDESMEFIAYECGFQTAQNMYLVFRRDLSISPTAFRNNAKERVDR